MKTYMPLNGLRWSRNSGSANCDMPQSAVFGRPGGGFFVFLAVLMIIPRILLICILVISILIAIFATEALPIFATISILNINITN